MGREVRYALTVASMHSLSHNIPPILLRQLVESKQWSFEQALASAYHQQEPLTESQALIRLFTYPGLDKKTRSFIQDRMLQAVQRIEDDYDRAEMLATLFPHLSPESAKSLLQDALRTAGYLDPNSGVVSGALALLIPCLPEAEKPQAIERLEASLQLVDDNYDRARTVAAFIPHSATDGRLTLLQSALASAWMIEDSRNWAKAVAALALRLAEMDRYRSLAICIARSIGFERGRAEAQARMSEYLSRIAQRDLAESVAASIDPAYRYFKVEAETSSETFEAKRPNMRLITDKLRTLRTIGDVKDRAKVISALMPYFIMKKRLKVSFAATGAVLQIYRRSLISIILLAVMVGLTAAAQWIELSKLSPALAELARLDLWLTEWSLRLAVTPFDPTVHNNLKSLFPVSPPRALITNLSALMPLIPLYVPLIASIILTFNIFHLSLSKLLHALYGFSAIVLVIGLARIFSSVSQTICLVFFCVIAWRIWRSRSRRLPWWILLCVGTIVGVVPLGLFPVTLGLVVEVFVLPLVLIAMAFSTGFLKLGGVTVAVERAWRLMVAGFALIFGIELLSGLFAIKSSPSLLNILLLLILTWFAVLAVNKCLGTIIGHISLFAEAPVIAWAFGGVPDRARALNALAPRIQGAKYALASSPAKLRKVMTDEHKLIMRLEGQQPEVLKPSAEAVRDALASAVRISNASERAELFAAIEPQFKSLPLPIRYNYWHDALEVLMTRNRQNLLSDLLHLWPIMETLGKKEVARDIIGAIMVVSRWWP